MLLHKVRVLHSPLKEQNGREIVFPLPPTGKKMEELANVNSEGTTTVPYTTVGERGVSKASLNSNLVSGR